MRNHTVESSDCKVCPVDFSDFVAVKPKIRPA